MALAGPMLYAQQRCRNAASEHSLAVLKLKIEFEKNDNSGAVEPVAGTAFFVSDRCAITAMHIVRPKDEELTNFHFYKAYAGFADTPQIEVLVNVHYTGHDIAILQFPETLPEGLKSHSILKLGGTIDVRPGDSLCSFGFPGDESDKPMQAPVQMGGSVRAERYLENRSVWSTSIQSKPGFSGAPVMHDRTGMVFAIVLGAGERELSVVTPGAILPLNLVSHDIQSKCGVTIPSHEIPSMVKLDGGERSIGSLSTCPDAIPLRKVDVPEFEISRGLITNSQYKQAYPRHKFDDDGPVTNITWAEARAYCQKITEPGSDYEFSLPDEIEWEVAEAAGRLSHPMRRGRRLGEWVGGNYRPVFRDGNVEPIVRRKTDVALKTLRGLKEGDCAVYERESAWEDNRFEFVGFRIVKRRK